MQHRVFKIRNKKSDFDEMVVTCSNYMESGTYHVEKIHGKLGLKKGTFCKNKLKQWYYWLMCGNYSFVNELKLGSCEKILTSPFHNYKMFDEKNGITITSFSDKSWDNIVRFYNELSPFYPNLIISIDYQNHTLEEKIADTSKVDNKENVFFSFCDRFLKYSEKIAIESRITIEEVSKRFLFEDLTPNIKNYMQKIYESIKTDKCEYPVIICHNDVHTKNILVDDKQFKLIDFELCGENIFFFDIFGLIFNSAIFNEDLELFEMYLKGIFDNILNTIFEQYKLEYDKNNKMFYVYLFLYFRMYMIYKSDKNHLDSYISRFEKFEDYLSKL